MQTRTFTLTPDHIKLVQKFHVGWQDCETGAPEIDPKRPYGNSDVEHDIAEILGWVKVGSDADLSGFLFKKAEKLHRETAMALQIILSTGSFKPGVYQCDMYNVDWNEI